MREENQQNEEAGEIERRKIGHDIREGGGENMSKRRHEGGRRERSKIRIGQQGGHEEKTEGRKIGKREEGEER